MRFLFVAHGAGFAFGRIEQRRLLLDLAAILENVELTPGLVLDRLPDEAARGEVLDLAAGGEGRTGLADRHNDVGAQLPRLHVASPGSEVAQNGTQLRPVSLGT